MLKLLRGEENEDEPEDDSIAGRGNGDWFGDFKLMKSNAFR